MTRSLLLFIVFFKALFLLPFTSTSGRAQTTNTFPLSGPAGIGTTTPSEDLTIKFPDANGNAGGLAFRNLNNTEIFSFKTDATANSYIWSYYDLQLTANYIGAIKFAAGGAERLKIAANGNIGVGEAYPNAKISFQDAGIGTDPIGIAWSSAEPLDYGIFRTPGSWAGPDYQQLGISWKAGIVLDPGVCCGKSYVDIKGNGLRVSTGKVGIGTTNPSTLLSLGSGVANNKLAIYDDGGARLGIGVGNSQFRLHLAAPDHRFSFLETENSTEELMTILGTGKVGIGKSSPQAALDVNGNIFANGKIAIGTTDLNKIGSYSLAVNGDAIFNKVKVKLYTTWPDYVFENGYKLPSLKEIENYIVGHKHLPDIPSAQNVKDSGLDLGDTQALLLKKIEELTLYAIDQEKKIQVQDATITHMQEELADLKQIVGNILKKIDLEADKLK